ncbi:MAG: hypothetical protein Q9163_003239 [Psora crenata]
MDWQQQTKSVRREDIQSDASSSSPPQSLNTNLAAEYLKRVGETYNGGKDVMTKGTGSRVGEPVSLDGGECDADGYDFRLFARPTKAQQGPAAPKSAVQRVVLRSPTPARGEPGFIISRRADHFYFTGSTSSEQAEQYRQAAVSGEDLMAGLKTRWRGCELPWRVTVLKSPLPSRTVNPLQAVHPADAKRTKRSGKKRRIVLRKRLAAENARKLATQQSNAEREELEKGKRNQKNRERKIKRRQKEREKKATQAP